MRLRVGLNAAAALLLALWLTGAEPTDEDHSPSIRSIEIGMTAQEVLDRRGRMPDSRKDEKEEVLVYWKLEDGSLLQVNFRQEHVSHLALKYGAARPTTDLWLQPLTSGGSVFGQRVPEGELTARDPRWRVDYKVAETGDKKRVVWAREVEAPEGYRLQIRFLSTSRDQLGDRFEEYVEFKYVTVPKRELKKFDKAVKAKASP